MNHANRQIGLMTAFLLLLSAALLTGCGNGGGDRASGVEQGPTDPGGSVTPPDPILPADTVSASDLTSDDSLSAAITGLTLNSPLTLTFSVTANGVQQVTDVTSQNVRFSLAKLLDNSGDSVGEYWESYINSEEDPICRSAEDVASSDNNCSTFTASTDPGVIPDSARKVQDTEAIGKTITNHAATESDGILIAVEGGLWSYTYATDIGDPATLNEVHRACIQFSFASSVDNQCIDFIPSQVIDPAIGNNGTSLADDFYDNNSARKIAADASCNSCHDKLAIHGGGRTQLDYCVTCHNPGSTDANSGNTVDLKVLTHKIHYGRLLQKNVDDGIAYKIWGYKNGEHDYSKLSYPQNVMNCTRCHAGAEDVEYAAAEGIDAPEAEITPDGHNWAANPTRSACESCHEKLFTDNLKINGSAPGRDHTGYAEDRDCSGCHSPGGSRGANVVHRSLAEETGKSLSFVIDSITNTNTGETPVVTFAIQDKDGVKLDLKDTAVMCSAAKWDLRMPYDSATEFTARISGSGTPTDLTAQGGNLFSISPSSTVPADVESIAVMLDWNYLSDCADNTSDVIRIDAEVSYAASTAASASERRTIVEVSSCNNCHDRFLLTSQKHSGTRSVNNPLACVACHTAEFSTSDRTREMAVMTHALHAPAIRESAHGGYDEDTLQYPGDLSDCVACHSSSSYQLPLPTTRQAIRTTSTPTYTSPVAAICSGCHDDALAKAHMESSGGAIFDSTFANADITEACDSCHGTGKEASVETVHNR